MKCQLLYAELASQANVYALQATHFLWFYIQVSAPVIALKIYLLAHCMYAAL